MLSSLISGIWKRIQTNLFAEQKQTHRLWKTYGYQRGQAEGREGWTGVWDGNVLKLGCDDGCATINIIKFIEFKKINFFSKPKKKEAFTWLTYYGSR